MRKCRFLVTSERSKEIAQGFVEFALAVPILLMVLYGLLEVGRLLFIYSSVVTAARQAVRYGAVTGVSDGGYPRYQDCSGIRNAARHVGFLNEFQDSGINITYDAGPGTAAFASCDGTDYLAVQPETGDRLMVSVSAIFQPILPLLPIKPMTIESSSSRTILRNIDIYVEADPEGWDGSDDGGEYTYDLPTATPTITKTPTATYTPTNTPTNTPTPKFSPTPSRTPTNTYTPTVTYTPTITYTPTDTGTPTYTPSPTGTPIACYVSHDGLSIVQNKMLLTVHNDSDYPITISQIAIFYNASSPAGQGLGVIYVDGSLAWDQAMYGSPSIISNFPENISIDPRSSLALKFFFEKNLKTNGTENIMISFVENGCPIHDTTP